MRETSSLSGMCGGKDEGNPVRILGDGSAVSSRGGVGGRGKALCFLLGLILCRILDMIKIFSSGFVESGPAGAAAVLKGLASNAAGGPNNTNGGGMMKASDPARQAPIHVWTFIDKTDLIAPVVRLNLKTWKHHNPNIRINIVNDTTVRDYIPDLPEEFFRLYAQAKSDAFRAGVIYHHGGFYVDTDFLVMKPLTKLSDFLLDHDIASYGLDGACSEHFSSNFHGGRQGNQISYVWWQNIKDKITRVCGKGEMKEDKVCCHAEDEPDPIECHIPWAYLEHLKFPEMDHDENPKYQILESNVSRACLWGNESFIPDTLGIGNMLYWADWPYNKNGKTCGRKGNDLWCKEGGEEKRTRHFFDRIAHHLFFSQWADKQLSEEELLGSNWLISYMYRESLSLPWNQTMKQESKRIDTSTKGRKD